MFRTLLTGTPYSDDGSLFIYLGTKKVAGVRKKLAFPFVTEEVFQAIKDISIQALLDGVTVIVNQDVYTRDKQWIDAIQKHLAMAYCKYVLFPRQSGTIPDLAGARKEGDYILIPREIQKAENIPLYLQSPLCNKLKGLAKNLPVTILLPGPSLNKTASLLKELQEKCLIICVPRTVAFCRQAGVEPDFVVSLDTAARMQHMVSPSTPLPNTYLVALSPGALAKPAQSYRGLFLMESFDTSILPDTYRLRESWLSCSISTLGLAELLESQTVFLAGGDHSWEDQSTAAGNYWNSGETGGTLQGKTDHPLSQPPGDENYFGPAMVKDLEEWTPSGIPSDACMQTRKHDAPLPGLPDRYTAFTLADRNGRRVRTFFHYYAISAELEQVAHEMATQAGATCYLLEDSGILSENIFKKGGREKLHTLPPINRKSFISHVDAAHAIKERINYDTYITSLNVLANTVTKNIALLTFFLHDDKINDAIQHTYVQSIDKASSQRKTVAVRDYRFRAKFDCSYNFYEHQLHRLAIDSLNFPLLKKEFYEPRIKQCKKQITKENFEQVRGTLFPEDEVHAVQTTIRACATWRDRLEEGIALCQVYQDTTRQGVIVLWCLPEEKLSLFKSVSRTIGHFMPHFATIVMQNTPPLVSKTLESIYIDEFVLFSNACRHAQVAGYGFQKEYGYLLNLTDKRKIVPIQFLNTE